MSGVLDWLSAPFPAFWSASGVLDARPAAKYVFVVGTLWTISNQAHQLLFRKAWDNSWWLDRRVQKGAVIQKEPTKSVRAVPRLEVAVRTYVFTALNWFAFHRFWLDVDSPLPTPLAAIRKLFVGMLACDAIYYAYHRLQHSITSLYRMFHRRHHAFFILSPEAVEWDEDREFFPLMFTTDVFPALVARMDFFTYCIWRLLNEIREEHFHSGCKIAARRLI
jgi:sterol desaturase/sphingolipid hydroxylase (fatty acid hydroxylase superfamily)